MAKLPIRIEQMPWIDVLDRNHLRTTVDGELTVFSRKDRYTGHPGSGLANFGFVSGDWRMVRRIADDISTAFELLDAYIARQD